jgi:hypothetical protein
MAYDTDLLKDIIQMGQKDLKNYLELHLQDLGYTPICKKGFLYAQGTIPVLLIAHLDTVHRQKADIICFSPDMRYVMSPQGIGGDDRCGVYMILQIINRLPCHVLFCEDEEKGGIGAKAFTRADILPSVNYIVEMDRRGSNDAVFYRCNNPEFTDFVLSFGFKENHGTFSDISVIAPYLDTAAVNISAGYYNEHSQHEYIDMVAVENNIRRISEMLLVETDHFEYIQEYSSNRQISIFGDFGWVPMEETPAIQSSKRKLLMVIPDSALIVAGNYKILSNSKYLIDKDGKIYVYIKELNAAVETEHVFSCDSNGNQIDFVADMAKQMKVITFDEAIMTIR